MPLILISCNLNKPENDYPKLITYLEQIGAKRVLYSEWMLKSNDSRDAIFDDVRRCIDADDRLMVCDVNSAIGTANLMHALNTF